MIHSRATAACSFARSAVSTLCCAASLALPAAAFAVEPLEAGRALSAAERADADVLKKLYVASLNSSDMRIRVFIGRTPDPTDGDSRHTLVPIDTLAGQIRGSTDPMVLAMMVDPCSQDRLKPKPTCDALEIATRWTVADTQNQVAWLTLASTLQSRGDEAGARRTFQRASQASVWHEYLDDIPRIAARALPAALGPYGRIVVLQAALNTAGAYLLPFNALHTLSRHCKDAELHDACLKIIDTIDRDGGSLMSAQMGVRIGEQAGVEPQVTAARRRKLDALRGAEPWSDWRDLADLTNPADQNDEAARLQHRVDLGEMGWLRAAYADSGLSEDVAAERYRRRLDDMRRRAAAESRAAAD